MNISLPFHYKKTTFVVEYNITFNLKLMKPRLYLLTLLALFASINALAYDAEVDGIYYNFTSENEAEVTYRSFGETNYSGNVVIPDSITYNDKTYCVTSIGEKAFSGRSSLTSITIPSNVTSIGSDAFWDCRRLTSVHITDLAAWCNILFYNSSSQPLIYAYHLYLNGEEITDLVIPEGVTSIGNYAFKRCSALTSIIIPEGVTSIGKDAFADCSSLTSISIPEGLTSIGDGAFAGCSSLTSISIPEGLTSIGDGAFDGCYFLNDSFVNHSELLSDDNWGALLYDKETNDGLLIKGDTIIKCRNWATSVSIPEGVTSIGAGAFSRCTSLTSVNIPNSVTCIDSFAFDGCSSLTSVHITDLTAWCNISFNGGYCNPLQWAQHLYLNSKEITNLIIPEGVTHIGNETFHGGSNFTSITIPESVTCIGENAFCACSGLTSITLPNSVISIEGLAFQSCTGLTIVNIGNGVTSIGHDSFYDCTNLTNVYVKMETPIDIGESTFPNRSRSTLYVPIGYKRAYSAASYWKDFKTIKEVNPDIAGIFYDYDNSNKVAKVITSPIPAFYAGDIIIPSSVTYNDETYNVTSINSKAFFECTGLTSITIPSSVTSIGGNAFQNCTGLTSTTLSNGIETIGSFAFSGCTILTSIIIPKSVMSIGSSVFKDCRSLTSINIPEGVTSIGGTLFSGCSDLSFVILPKSVTSIGSKAFYGCTNLTSITIPENVTSIGGNAFQNCSSLTSVTLNNALETISSSAFSGCTSLISIMIPGSVTSIGTSAFANNNSLTNVYCYAKELPNTNSYSFNKSPIESATLHVPEVSLELYKTTAPWSGFGTIVAIDALNVLATSISLSPTILSFNDSNQTATLIAIVTPSNATNKNIKWTSNNTAVAIVNNDGVVTSKANGTAIITAQTTDGSNLTASCLVSVTGGDVAADNYRYYNLVITRVQGGGNAIQFSEFDLLDESLDEVEGITVYAGTESDNSDENWGNITDNDIYTKYCKGNFSDNAYFLFDAMSDVTLYGYRFYTANDTQRYPERNPSSWKLYGSHTKLANPNSPNWVLIDERNNDRTMQATYFTPYDFYIKDISNKLTLSKHSIILTPGKELQLEVNDRFNSIQDLTLQWTSSNTAVAVVNEQGIIVAKNLGTADIIVSAIEDNTLCDTCTVNVEAWLPEHRYYQFAIEAIGSGNVIQFSEFNLIDKNGDEIKPITLYAYTGSFYNDESQRNLFDNNVETKYCGRFTSDTTLYLFIDAGKEVTLSGYRITTANDSNNYPERNPTSWSLLGSNTQSEQPNDAVWTLLDHHENDNTIGARIFTPYDFFFTYSQEIIDDVCDSKYNQEDTQGIYNLAGQRLSKPQKGINIINGKMVLIK